MNRRDAALALLMGLFVPGTTPRATEPRPQRTYRVGYLSAPSRKSVENALSAFIRALRDLGWVEGQNLRIEYRWADGDVARLPALAADLVARQVDVIVAPAGSAALAAKSATSTIPIVMIFPNDPVGTGLVASLARPGGNITGTTFTPSPEILGKQLQILKEAVPRATRVAILWNPGEPGRILQSGRLDAAARSLGIHLQNVEARGPDEFDGVFAAMARERADALVVAGGSAFLVHRSRLAELAAKGRLPAIYSYRENVEAGGLMSYAVHMADFIGRAAVYVDKILRGAKPADLAVEQPTRLELVINLRAAKAIGLTVPQSLLLRADELIQ
jgi:putative ABC transport system substrate-binding protein